MTARRISTAPRASSPPPPKKSTAPRHISPHRLTLAHRNSGTASTCATSQATGSRTCRPAQSAVRGCARRVHARGVCLAHGRPPDAHRERVPGPSAMPALLPIPPEASSVPSQLPRGARRGHAGRPIRAIPADQHPRSPRPKRNGVARKAIHVAYAAARQAEARSSRSPRARTGTTWSCRSRKDVRRDRATIALAQMGRLDEAILAVEHSRTQSLAELARCDPPMQSASQTSSAGNAFSLHAMRLIDAQAAMNRPPARRHRLRNNDKPTWRGRRRCGRRRRASMRSLIRFAPPTTLPTPARRA